MFLYPVCHVREFRSPRRSAHQVVPVFYTVITITDHCHADGEVRFGCRSMLQAIKWPSSLEC